MHGKGTATDHDVVDDRLLTRLTNAIVCSRCLRNGVRTTVRQIVSARHAPLTLCRDCRHETREH